MFINERCISILSILNETNKFTLKTLSKNFNVHIRTIRYDIDNINYILKMHKLDTIKKCGKGMFTVNLDNDKINKIINNFSGMFSENRKKYLKLKLFSNDIINLTKEAEYLNVSRTTAIKDLRIIKMELSKKSIEIKELPSKGIKVVGNEDDIIDAFEKEIFGIIEKKFINFPPLIKNLAEKIVGNIAPDILKDNVKEVLGENYTINSYNKVFCKLAAINTRQKIEKKPSKYKIEDIKNFIKIVVEENENKKYKAIKTTDILIDVFKELQLESEKQVINKLILEINHIRENLPIPEKIFETNFYKDFEEKIKSTKLATKDTQSIFYILYSNLLLKNFELFKEMKVLFVSDEVDSVKYIILNKLKVMFDFEEIDKISPHIFEIFGCEKEYDLIITTSNINGIFQTPLYWINRFPLESDFVDLKFFILKNILIGR